MTKSIARKAPAAKAHGTYRKIARRKTARKLAPEGAQHRSQDRTKSSLRRRTVHIARPTLNSRNSLALGKCQSQCALSPRRA